MTQKEIELAIANGIQDKVYPYLVQSLIKRKYHIEDELALHRQRDIKQDEFNEYNNYCEQCKAEAKAILHIDNV